jgi:hypothetical protein
MSAGTEEEKGGRKTACFHFLSRSHSLSFQMAQSAPCVNCFELNLAIIFTELVMALARTLATSLVLLLASVLRSAAAIQPYTTDSATLHLWHFDESMPPAVDYAPGGTNLTYQLGGATLGNVSYSNGPVSFTNCVSFGGLNTSNAVLFPIGSGYVGTPIPFTYAGTNGAFSFEAMVHVEFNPTNFVRNQPCQLLNCDADSSGTRVFQFRLDPVGFIGGGGDTNFVRIEFINGTTTVAMAPIPTNGPDVIVSNAWYHVAATYNGAANTTSNLLFYWTLLNTNRAAADCIYGTTMTAALPGTSSATTIFSIGNSARNPSGGTGPAVANFLGKIDEVRISSIARSPSNMLFVAAGITIISQPSPTNQLIGTGQPFGLSVTAVSQLPLTYQWRRNGVPLANATNSAYWVASAQQSDSGTYDVLITNSLATADSTSATVTVTNLAIVTQPVSVAAGYAGTATFNVVAVGAQPISYQWRKSGTPILNVTNNILVLGSLSAGDAGNYDVLVFNSLASLTSTVATLTIGGPQLTLTPVSDGTPGASGYAYAGASAINAVAFICSGLMTVSNQQFFAYYGRHQTDPSYAYNNTIWIARRTLGSSVWQVFRTTFTADDITDGHDVVVFGIDGGGYMHLSWGMHDANLHYARSTAPVVGSQSVSFGPDLGTMTGVETSVTYPQFFALPNGDLLFLYRIGASGGGDTWLNRWSVAGQTWTNVNASGGSPIQFIKGLWPSTNYNAYPNMPCLDAAGNFYLVWTWRETPAYQSNHDLNFAKSTDGGITWRRFDNTPYDLPISKSGESGDPNTVAEVIVPIPQNYSLINQAGMSLDAFNNPVVATWWAPGSGTNNYRRQYMVAFPDTNGLWQTRQISNRTNDPPGTMMLDSAVRDLGRPVVVCDQQDRLIVLYRDNFGSNGLTLAYSLPYALDPLRTNWTTLDLTTDNLGNYEPVIDLARWQRDNVLDMVYQPSSGEGYAPPTNTASPIGVLEWNAAAYFHPHPALELSLINSNRDAALYWNSQPGWGYQVQWSTNLAMWNVAATLSGISGYLPQQYVHTNGAVGPQRFWRLQLKEGGF